MSDPNFWADRKNAEKVARQARLYKQSIEAWDDLSIQHQDLCELQDMATIERDESTLSDLQGEVEELTKSVELFEFQSMLIKFHIIF